MGKINKYANVYTKDGDLLRHVEKDGILHNMTIKEIEDLLDKLVNDKDDDGNIKDPQAVNNVNAVLYQMYQKNPKYVKDVLKENFKNNPLKKTTTEEIQSAIETLKKEVEEPAENIQTRPSDDPNYSMDKYVDFEEIHEDEHKENN